MLVVHVAERDSQLHPQGKDTTVNTVRFKFGPEYRLRKRVEIRRCHDLGEKVYSKHFLVLLRLNKLPVSRLAITVTTKLDKRAVVRNRIKRRVREFFRQNRTKLKSCYDVVVVARRGAQDCKLEEVKREILTALAKTKFLVER